MRMPSGEKPTPSASGSMVTSAMTCTVGWRTMLQVTDAEPEWRFCVPLSVTPTDLTSKLNCMFL